MNTDKNSGVDCAKGRVETILGGMHPTDEAEAYRELAKWSEGEAQRCEDRNDREGVPER